MNELLEKELENNKDMGNDAGYIGDESLVTGTEATQENSEPVKDQVTESEAGEPGNVLPENVTEEPQHDEHMDLRGVLGYPQWLQTYLAVSDDDGVALGDPDTEREVQALCNDLKGKRLKSEPNPEQLTERIKGLSVKYGLLINRFENISFGIQTKYRIRQGMLFLALKELVKYGLKKKWSDWFDEHFDPKMRRSAQDYMRIAEVPNAIRYAVFGKERLLQIVQQVEKSSSEDPIGDFLRTHAIDYDPNQVVNEKDIRATIDIAIARNLLNTNGLDEIPDDKVKAIIDGGQRFNKYLIGQMKLAMDSGSDMTEYMDKLVANGGKVEPILTPSAKAKNYESTLSKFLQMTGEAIENPTILGKIEDETIQRLKSLVLALEEKIAARTDN